MVEALALRELARLERAEQRPRQGCAAGFRSTKTAHTLLRLVLGVSVECAQYRFSFVFLIDQSRADVA